MLERMLDAGLEMGIGQEAGRSKQCSILDRTFKQEAGRCKPCWSLVWTLIRKAAEEESRGWETLQRNLDAAVAITLSYVRTYHYNGASGRHSTTRAAAAIWTAPKKSHRCPQHKFVLRPWGTTVTTSSPGIEAFYLLFLSLENPGLTLLTLKYGK